MHGICGESLTLRRSKRVPTSHRCSSFFVDKGFLNIRAEWNRQGQREQEEPDSPPNLYTCMQSAVLYQAASDILRLTARTSDETSEAAVLCLPKGILAALFHPPPSKRSTQPIKHISRVVTALWWPTVERHWAAMYLCIQAYGQVLTQRKSLSQRINRPNRVEHSALFLPYREPLRLLWHGFLQLVADEECKEGLLVLLRIFETALVAFNSTKKGFLGERFR